MGKDDDMEWKCGKIMGLGERRKKHTKVSI
jgi:hypothetical protein